MGKERMIDTSFWDDQYISTFDPIEKLLFLYFLTNPLTNIAGIYEISLKRIAFDTGIDRETILKILERFEEAGRMYYREGYIIIKNFIKHQKVSEKSHIKTGIEKIISKLPEPIIKTLEGLYTDLEDPLNPLSYFNYNSNYNSNTNTNVNPKGLIDFFHNNFMEKFGVKPVINGAKDGAIFKKLLATNSEEEIKELLKRFFSSEDKFIKQSSYTVGVFFSVINKLLIECKQMQTEIDPGRERAKMLEDYQ